DRYARYWDTVLREVRLKSYTDADKVADLLENLDPLRSFYAEVAKQTLLERPELTRDQVLLLQGRIIERLRRVATNLDIWRGITGDYLGTKTLGDQVKFRFQSLQSLAGISAAVQEPPSSQLHDFVAKLRRYGNRVRNGGGEEKQKVAKELDGDAGTIAFPPYL